MEEIIKFTPDAMGPRFLLEQNGQPNGQNAILLAKDLDEIDRLIRIQKNAEAIMAEPTEPIENYCPVCSESIPYGKAFCCKQHELEYHRIAAGDDNRYEDEKNYEPPEWWSRRE